jgi:phosphoribosylglycinamide formyltransferase-1
MADWLEERGVRLVVLAGYMQLLTPAFLDRFPGRIVNVHPSLLPEFAGGMDAVEQALSGGAVMTGATVHLVTEDLDAGPILAQEAVPVLNGDTVETLRRRIHEAEYRILPTAIRLLEARLAESPAVGQ